MDVVSAIRKQQKFFVGKKNDRKGIKAKRTCLYIVCRDFFLKRTYYQIIFTGILYDVLSLRKRQEGTKNNHIILQMFIEI